MTDKPKKKAPPKRIALHHPKMRGGATVLEQDLEMWLAKGWVLVNPPRPQEDAKPEA